MPAHNVTATGYYLANEGSYLINYYVQDVNNNESYSLYSTESIPSSQGKVIDSLSKLNVIEGFKFEARHSVLSGEVPAETDTVTAVQIEKYKTEGDPTVTIVDGKVLNINYYYTREVHTLTLDVWTNEDRNVKVYTQCFIKDQKPLQIMCLLTATH